MISRVFLESLFSKRRQPRREDKPVIRAQEAEGAEGAENVIKREPTTPTKAEKRCNAAPDSKKRRSNPGWRGFALLT